MKESISHSGMTPLEILAAHRNEFDRRIYLATLERARSLAAVLILVSIVLFYVCDYQAYLEGLSARTSGYIYLLIWRVFLVAGLLLYLTFYHRVRPTSFAGIDPHHRLLAFSFVVFLLFIGASQSFIAQFLGTSDVSIYSISLIAVATAFHIPYHVRPVLYFVSFAGLAISLLQINLSSETLRGLLINSTTAVVVALILERLSYSQQIRSFADMKIIETERSASNRLLLNVLPEAIARRLGKDDAMIADSFCEASVLFADIVGFTELSVQMTPEKVVKMLNGVFSRFDSLLDEFAVEKIKTIGDAYMAVSGLPNPEPYHAHTLAMFALGMKSELAKFNEESNSQLQLRIGINSGPVVAGIIGTKKFAYDLWGDTVNIASRMESHGLAGEIQVTPATYKILERDFVFRERGQIRVKGVGTMTTYLVQGVFGAKS